MQQAFIEKIKINKVRHLQNINVPICKEKSKHIIFTGKNGSGKTSVLDAISTFLNSITKGEDPEKIAETVKTTKKGIQYYREKQDERSLKQSESSLEYWVEQYQKSTAGIWLNFNTSFTEIRKQFEAGNFVVAYYKADRIFTSVQPKHVEKVQLKSGYAINEMPRTEFIKYLLDLKMTQALAISGGKTDKAHTIAIWFEKFEQLLKQIFDDESVKLVFDEETFQFSIEMDGREPFDFIKWLRSNSRYCS